jgi:hypothetical protein
VSDAQREAIEGLVGRLDAAGLAEDGDGDVPSVMLRSDGPRSTAVWAATWNLRTDPTVNPLRTGRDADVLRHIRVHADGKRERPLRTAELTGNRPLLAVDGFSAGRLAALPDPLWASLRVVEAGQMRKLLFELSETYAHELAEAIDTARANGIAVATIADRRAGRVRYRGLAGMSRQGVYNLLAWHHGERPTRRVPPSR